MAKMDSAFKVSKQTKRWIAVMVPSKRHDYLNLMTKVEASAQEWARYGNRRQSGQQED